MQLNSIALTSLMLLLWTCQAQAQPHTVLVKWSPPAAQTGITVTGYKIYRATTAGAEGTTPYATITSATVTSFTDTAVTAGKTYFYKMTSVGTCDSTVWDCSAFTGESVMSAEFQTDKAIPLDPAPAMGAPTAATATVQ